MGELICAYTNRKLTHPADKLLAISAVAEVLGITFMGHGKLPGRAVETICASQVTLVSNARRL
jgi:hypothetical protein